MTITSKTNILTLFSREYILHPPRVYFYHFTHRTTHSPWPKWMGVIHADEIYYVFGDPLKKQSWIKYTDQERDLARTVMGYWANFAKNG